jgi:PAT family beta-lactamase induction signal transducer AmpG
LLVYSTQSAWLSEAGVPIETIGLLSELTIAYKFKFLWSPFLDKYDPPLLAPLVGRRRGWIVVSQIAATLALAGVAFGDPAHWIAWTIVFITCPRFRRRHARRDHRRLPHHRGAAG